VAATEPQFAPASVAGDRTIAAHGAGAARSFFVAAADAPDRARLESYIAGIYRSHYDARIGQWAPTLVGLAAEGRVLAAAGYRDASGPLFLERYLEAPIEAVIAARTGTRVARSEIVEVGHFAAGQPGEGRRLLPVLARHLARLGYRWVVSTATRELRVLLAHLRMRPLALGRADPDELGADAAQWGCYYDHEPIVVAGDLLRSLPLIEQGRHK